MPIYEYQCQACGKKLEVMQKLGDAPLRECPDCRQQELKKLVSAAAFRLKGGGWYETDFKSGAKKNIAGEGSKAESTSTGPGKSSGSTAGTAKGTESTSGKRDNKTKPDTGATAKRASSSNSD